MTGIGIEADPCRICPSQIQPFLLIIIPIIIGCLIWMTDGRSDIKPRIILAAMCPGSTTWSDFHHTTGEARSPLISGILRETTLSRGGMLPRQDANWVIHDNTIQRTSTKRVLHVQYVIRLSQLRIILKQKENIKKRLF